MAGGVQSPDARGSWDAELRIGCQTRPSRGQDPWVHLHPCSPHYCCSQPGSSRVLLMPGPVPAFLGQLGWGLLKPDRDHLGQVRGPGQAAEGPAVPPSLPRPSEHLWVPRKNVEKRALLENMEGLFLAVDEIVDGG